MSPFEVSYTPGETPVTIIKVSERVNMGNTAELENLARREFENGMRNLLLDLSETPSITSAGLRTIVIIYKMLASGVPAQGGSALNLSGAQKSPHFKLLGPTPEVYRVLDIAGMTRRFEIYEDLETALASFKA